MLHVGLVEALREASAEQKRALDIRAHPDSVYAGAIGAALWGGYRHRKLGIGGSAWKAPEAS